MYVTYITTAVNVKHGWCTGVVLNHFTMPTSSANQVHLPLLGVELHSEHGGVFPAFLSNLLKNLWIIYGISRRKGYFNGRN